MKLLDKIRGEMETERLVLRRWKREDLKPYAALVSDEEVMRLTGVEPTKNLEETTREFNADLRSDRSFAIVLRESGEVIGRIKFHADMHRFHVKSLSVSYELRREFWGCGYMTEALTAMIERAFEKEKVDVLAANHYSNNMRSRRVIEKCGFTYEGTIHHAVKIYDGSVVDDVCYYMVRQ